MTRIGASQVFFNIVAQFNAEKLIKDYRSVNTVMKAVSLDTFEAILKPIEGLGQAINTITDELNPLQEALGLAAVEFEKFFGQVPHMEAMRDEVIALGEAFNITAVEALAAGSRAAQVANIIGRSNVEVLMKLAFTLAEISDLNAEEAQRGIIQLHQQTGMLFGELDAAAFQRLSVQEQQNILVREGAVALDSLNTIANRSVALEGDLVRVMGTFAAQGELVGDSFHFMAAASATLLEAGEEQGTAGRALRMMYARLGGDISGARTEIEAMGFELTKGDGVNAEMKNMEEILTELAPSWRTMSGAQKQSIAQTIAGNRHYVRFIKLMENYDRTIQLATDGEMGFDSALGQANYALNQQVNLLRETQNEVETLKAEIGEGLTPFMQGQVDVQKQYLEVTHALTDGLGPLGKVMGRLKGVMGTMGGFIKVGLATQSLGIGMEMFTSVQRQLNGILVANEHLHSKSANHLKQGEKATVRQRDILLGMQYIEQKINANAAERKWMELGISEQLERQHYLEVSSAALDEKSLLTIERHAAAHTKLLALMKLKTAEAINENNMSAQRSAQLAYDATMEGDLLAKTTELYSRKTMKEAAMKKQYLADMHTAASLSEKEVATINKRHTALTRERDLLQQIKSDNALRGRPMGDGTGRDLTLPYNQKSSDHKGQMVMQQQDREFIAERLNAYSTYQMQGFATMADKQGIAMTKSFGKGNKHNQNRGIMAMVKKMKENNAEGGLQALGLYTDHLGAASLATKILSNDTSDLTSGEMMTANKLMTENNGQLVQTHRALDTLSMFTQEQIQDAQNLEQTQRELLDVETLLNSEDAEAIALAKERLRLNKELAPTMKKLEKMRRKDKQHTKDLIVLKDSLVKKETMLNKRQMAHIPTNNDTLKATKDATAANKQFAFAMNNTIGMLSGMVGGSAGASISLAFMTSNIIASGGAAVGAAKKMGEMQLKVVQNIKLSDSMTMSNYLEARGWEAKNIAMLKTKLIIAGILVAYAALGAAIYIFQKESKKAADEMAEMNRKAMNFESIMTSISKEKKILDDTDLAEAIGLDDMTTGDLMNNGGDVQGMIMTLEGAMGKFTDTQNTQIENALIYLNILDATTSLVNKTLNDKDFAEYEEGALQQLEGTWHRFKRGISDSFDIEAGQSLFDDINTYGMDFDDRFAYESESAALANFKKLTQYMEQGRKLTEEQLKLAGEYFNDTDITEYLKSMNQLVNTEEIRNYNAKKFAEDIEITNSLMGDSANEIKNLTDEIYSFSGAREELFFGGKYGNVTGSLYRTVVKQGVGTLYHKNEVIMTTNFHGFFNEQEAADRITRIVTDVLAA